MPQSTIAIELCKSLRAQLRRGGKKAQSARHDVILVRDDEAEKEANIVKKEHVWSFLKLLILCSIASIYHSFQNLGKLWGIICSIFNSKKLLKATKMMFQTKMASHKNVPQFFFSPSSQAKRLFCLDCATYLMIMKVPKVPQMTQPLQNLSMLHFLT